jgi:hypothetical protein
MFPPRHASAVNRRINFDGHPALFDIVTGFAGRPMSQSSLGFFVA